MTKAELLKLLEKVDDDAEVHMWNGYVDDYMNIVDVEVVEMVKETAEFIGFFAKMQYQRENMVFDIPEHIEREIEESARLSAENREWELPNPHLEPENYNTWYGTERRKSAIILCDTRGKVSFDRMGGMEY